MQTHIVRSASSEVPSKISPRAVSLEVPQKISPRAICQLRTPPVDSDSVNQMGKRPKDKISRVSERRSPRSHLSEKKRPSRVAKLEFLMSQPQDELKKMKDQISSSESWKKLAQQGAKGSKKQVLPMSQKLKQSQLQLLEWSASKEDHAVELQKLSQEQVQARKTEIGAIQKEHSVESTALASAMNEIKQLKLQLAVVTECEAVQNKFTESANAELHRLKENLLQTLSHVEDMKNWYRDSKEAEGQAQALVGETLLQLETAMKTVETLRLDNTNAMAAYNSIASELDRSRAPASFLEGLVNKLKADINKGGNNDIDSSLGDKKRNGDIREDEETCKSIEAELTTAKSEEEKLRSALETADIRYHKEQVQSTARDRCAYELVEQIRSISSQKAAELEVVLNKSKADIEELKANLMDKETELQGIFEENQGLSMKLKSTLSGSREYELEKELKKLKEDIESLKTSLIDKETELKIVIQEKDLLKLELKKKDMKRGEVNDEIVAKLEAARVAEQEALKKLGHVKEEADKSNRGTKRLIEQLEVAQATNYELEAELRRLRVYSDQWRKAAEAATAMLSMGNSGKFMESNYNPVMGKINSLYSEEVDDDLLKKKNGSMLKRIGVLWKKPQK